MGNSYKNIFSVGAVFIVIAFRDLYVWGFGDGVPWCDSLVTFFMAPPWWATPVGVSLLFATGIAICKDVLASLFSISGRRWLRAGAVSSAFAFAVLLVDALSLLAQMDGTTKNGRGDFILRLALSFAFLAVHYLCASRDERPHIVYVSLVAGGKDSDSNAMFEWKFGANLHLSPSIGLDTKQELLNLIRAEGFHMDMQTQIEIEYVALSNILPGLQSALNPHFYTKIRNAFAQYLLRQQIPLANKYRRAMKKHIEKCAKMAGLKNRQIYVEINDGESADEKENNPNIVRRPLYAQVFAKITLSSEIRSKLAVADEAQARAILGSTDAWVEQIHHIFSEMKSGTLQSIDLQKLLAEMVALSQRMSVEAQDDFKANAGDGDAAGVKDPAALPERELTPISIPEPALRAIQEEMVVNRRPENRHNGEPV